MSESLGDRLARAAKAPSVVGELRSVIEELEAAGAGLDTVGTVLGFMEAHPLLDIGKPGPLVHYLERFHRRGLEAELLASLRRRPTPSTVWMVNRQINAAKTSDERAAWIEAMRAAGEHPAADDATRAEVAGFLSWQARA